MAAAYAKNSEGKSPLKRQKEEHAMSRTLYVEGEERKGECGIWYTKSFRI
ncbi:hypothetical protein CLOSTHATH_02669 [Hungatella hathewayi DSM 13479]|uniref:Uncharacterized protein n=1 Tax=Hungatella hathewayi DSM 13479 TaxID=566550 RepID=D3AGD3_9FIRM|nr:hypothetical protein CLOSTHATH_02669 [Hungatella hathewayi DSM 13479]